VTWISAERRRRVRATSQDRCGYCHVPQAIVLGALEVDHIIPTEKGGSNEEENLWLACSVCNGHKSKSVVGFDFLTDSVVQLFNPRTDDWNEHFNWDSTGGILLGNTAIGRATIAALQLNEGATVRLRLLWVGVGWFPPASDRRWR
jgi:hypothetical protein